MQDNSNKLSFIKEGTIVKGGVSNPPSIKRPESPKGQNGLHIEGDRVCPKHGDIKKRYLVLERRSVGELTQHDEYCADCYNDFLDKNVSHVTAKIEGDGATIDSPVETATEINHFGDCSIYASGCDICDCGEFRRLMASIDREWLSDKDKEALLKHQCQVRELAHKEEVEFTQEEKKKICDVVTESILNSGQVREAIEERCL